MSFNAHSKAMTQINSQYFYLATGFCLGLLLASFLALFLNRQGWQKYQRMLLRLKRAQKNNLLIQKTMTQLSKEQQDNQDLLEDRVQERTLELNIALQELESVNQELERKNVLDELTGLHNRRLYDQKILAEYRRSRRNLTALS